MKMAFGSALAITSLFTWYGFSSLMRSAHTLSGSPLSLIHISCIDSLTSIGIEVNQAIIIPLGIALWLAALVVAILFVMSYAKKVKAKDVYKRQHQAACGSMP